MIPELIAQVRGLPFACATLGMLASCSTAPLAGSGVFPDGESLRVAAPLADYYDTRFLVPNEQSGGADTVSVDALADRLAAFDVILFGESHGHPGIHLQQQALFRALHARRRDIALSMEQFERDVQPTVDAYLAGKAGENALREDGRAWDNYLSSYRPLVEYARASGLPVIAANAPYWAIVCIGQQGPGVLDRFSPQDRRYVAPDLDLRPGPYREKFLAFQGGSSTHGGGAAPSPEAAARADRSYAAQVARDETMAQAIVEARGGRPERLVFHLNGSFHSSGFLGVAERLKRLDPALKVAVIEPVEVANPKSPRVSRADLRLGTALILAYPSPAMFVEGEDQSAWVTAMMTRRRGSQCKYPPPAAASP
jgi:uncharacterized iron-regulated protein